MLALLTLTLGWTNASAQTWTASEVGEGYALLYNIGTGQYFTRGNGYDTQASIGAEGAAMIVELKSVGDNYFIRTGVNNTAYGLEHLSGSVYTDQSRNKQSTWTFTQVATENGPVYNIVSADNHNGGAGTYLTVQDESTIVGEGSDGTKDNAKWKVFLYTDQQDKLQTAMASATEENPVDVTAYILDHNFAAFKDYANEFWTMQSSNYNPNGGSITNPVAESWRAAFTLSQTITVPNGYYKLRAQAAVTEYTVTGQDMPVVYLNEATVPFKSMVNGENALSQLSTNFADGQYWTDYTDVVTVAGKSITVGVKGTRTDTWCAWDNFQLQYLGPIDLSAYVQGLADAVAAAEAFEGKIPTAAYNAIAEVVTDNNKTYESSEDYEAAIDAINTAISTYASAEIVAAYAIVVDAKAMYNQTNYTDKDGAKATFKALIDAADATTNLTDLNAAIVDLKAGVTPFISTVSLNENAFFDVTNFFVVNPTVRQNTTGWTIANLSDPGWNSSAGVCNFDECEFYQRNFKFYQTLALTPGTWEFGVTGFHREGNHNTHFYAGDDKILIPGVPNTEVNSMEEAKNYFDAGNGKVALKFLVESAQNVEIGINNQDTETDKWTIFRDFTLKYYGAPDYSVYEDQWAAAVAAANAAKADAANANVTGSELTALNDAIADSPAGSNLKATYIAKISALEAATQDFTAAAPSYDKYVAYKYETTSLFGSDLGVAAPTTAAEALVAVQNLNIAQYNKVATDYPYSLTSKIGDFSTWTGTAEVGTPRVDGTPNSLSWEHWSGVTHPYYEQDGTGYNNAGGWTIQYTKTTTLPAGSYVVKVAARSSAGVTSKVTCTALPGVEISLPRDGNNTRGINTDGEASWDENDTFISTGGLNATVGGTGAGWQWRFLPFTLDAETEVTMTFYAEASTQAQWMSIADGELLSAENIATAVAYNEAVENTIKDVDLANVTITRTIKEGYNTVCLPFDLTLGQVESAFGSGTEVYAFSESSADPMNATINFNKVVAGTITANVPVLVKATAASTEQVFEGVQVKAAESAVVEGTNFDFVGLYAPISNIPEGDYFIGNGALYKSKGATRMKAFRAYIKAKTAGANVKMFINDEGVDAISLINDEPATGDVIFNIIGQRVNKAQKGLYIVNGKKVLVK